MTSSTGWPVEADEDQGDTSLSLRLDDLRGRHQDDEADRIRRTHDRAPQHVRDVVAQALDRISGEHDEEDRLRAADVLRRAADFIGRTGQIDGDDEDGLDREALDRDRRKVEDLIRRAGEIIRRAEIEDLLAGGDGPIGDALDDDGGSDTGFELGLSPEDLLGVVEDLRHRAAEAQRRAEEIKRRILEDAADGVDHGQDEDRAPAPDGDEDDELRRRIEEEIRRRIQEGAGDRDGEIDDETRRRIEEEIKRRLAEQSGDQDGDHDQDQGQNGDGDRDGGGGGGRKK